MTCNHAESRFHSFVGGPPVYARAAIDDISFPAPILMRRRLRKVERSEGAGALFDELRAKDPSGRVAHGPQPASTIRALRSSK